MADDIASALSERVIAEFNEYNGLLMALRARAQELQSANGYAGLPDIAKPLLAPLPPKRIRMINLGILLAGLGAKLIMVEDPEALARTQGRVARRKQPMHSSGRQASISWSLSRRFLQKIGRIGGRNSRRKMTPWHAQKLGRTGAKARAKSLSAERRTAIAKMAAAARWKKAPVNSESLPNASTSWRVREGSGTDQTACRLFAKAR